RNSPAGPSRVPEPLDRSSRSRSTRSTRMSQYSALSSWPSGTTGSGVITGPGGWPGATEAGVACPFFGAPLELGAPQAASSPTAKAACATTRAPLIVRIPLDSRSSGGHEAAAHREKGRLGAVAQAGLAQDRRDVVLDRSLAQRELPRDLAVGRAGR